MTGRTGNTNKRFGIRTVGTVLLCVLLIAAALTTTYSWITRKWSATIEEPNLRIEANNSIAFRLNDESSGASNHLNLADLMGGISNFTLKPVSNCSGNSEDFFYLDKSVSPYRFSHVSIADYENLSLWRTAAKENGYIEVTLFIVCEGLQAGQRKCVILSDESHIHMVDPEMEYAASAIRVSLTIDSATRIFSKEGQGRTYYDAASDGTLAYNYVAINNRPYTDSNGAPKWYLDGVTFYEGGDELEIRRVYFSEPAGAPAIPNQSDKLVSVSLPTGQPYKFTDFGGYVTDDQGQVVTDSEGAKYIDLTKCLFWFDQDTRKSVTVRLWLEGEDMNCVDAIAGSEVNFLLSFISATTVNTPVTTIPGYSETGTYYKIVEQLPEVTTGADTTASTPETTAGS